MIHLIKVTSSCLVMLILSWQSYHFSFIFFLPFSSEIPLPCHWLKKKKEGKDQRNCCSSRSHTDGIKHPHLRGCYEGISVLYLDVGLSKLTEFETHFECIVTGRETGFLVPLPALLCCRGPQPSLQVRYIHHFVCYVRFVYRFQQWVGRPRSYRAACSGLQHP